MTTTHAGPAPVLRRSLDQRLQALALANDIRIRRANFKRSQPTAAQVADLLAEPPWWAASMKALDLLKVVPTVGPKKARQMLRSCLASESKTVAGVSDRQRRALIAAVIRTTERPL